MSFRRQMLIPRPASTSAEVPGRAPALGRLEPHSALCLLLWGRNRG